MSEVFLASPSRSTHSMKEITAAIGGGVGLFVGFVMGANITLPDVQFPHFFGTETVRFSKISWLDQAFKQDVHFAEAHDSNLQIEVGFQPFTLPKNKIAKHQTHKKYVHGMRFSKPARSAYLDLARAYQKLIRLQRELPGSAFAQNEFRDYRLASARMQDTFLASWLKPSVDTNLAQVISAPASPPSPSRSIAVLKKRRKKKIFVDNVIAAHTHQEAVNQAPHEVTTQEEAPQIVVNTQAANAPQVLHQALLAEAETVKYQNSAAETPAPEQPGVNQVSETGGAMYATPEMIANLDHQNESGAVATSISAPQEKPAEKKVETAALIGTNIGVVSVPAPANKVYTNPQYFAKYEAAPQTAPLPVVTKSNQQQEELPPSQDQNTVAHGLVASKSNGLECEGLKGHTFLKGSIQICPEQKTWISKSWNGSGWVKVESSEHLPTVTMHPAPNHGSTLLLNQNAVALLAIKSGLRIAKGAGIILGTVPAGYKVEFAGRAEETEYFEANGNSHFVILNAEPGASVIQLLAEKNNAVMSSVFTPVFEDTITYLDLGAPVATSLPIQVIKNGGASDPEIAGLTVGLSTQSGIQAITQSDGRATLKNVMLVPGFPVFVDVSSRAKDQQSYTYRYELTQKTKDGNYFLPQVSETSIARWLKQVKQGLSDQSAMVLGAIDRHRIDGFKKNYYAKVVTRSAHFGLEPKNYTILWNGQISEKDPLEGDRPRFMSVQVPEGLSEVQILNESNQILESQLIPVSPRVIHVVSQ